MASEEDYSWMELSTTDDAWQRGFDKFMDDLFEGEQEGQSLLCPCCKCRCMAYHNRDTIEGHLVRSGLNLDFIKEQKHTSSTCC
jgi:hypothetical protein